MPYKALYVGDHAHAVLLSGQSLLVLWRGYLSVLSAYCFSLHWQQQVPTSHLSGWGPCKTLAHIQGVKSALHFSLALL